MSFPLLKTGLLVDINNLYYSLQRKFGKGRRLKMVEYTKHLESLGLTIVHKIAYGQQVSENTVSFVTMLRNEGWEVHFGNTSWAIAMALRAADIAPNLDCFVLGTNFDQAGRILEWMKGKGKLTKCFACDIPQFFRQIAECVEIQESLLSEPVKV